jgi:hypothetical protein
MAMRDHFGDPNQRAAAARAAAQEKTGLYPDASHDETSSPEIKKEAANDMGMRAAEMAAANDDWALSLIKVHSVQVSSF